MCAPNAKMNRVKKALRKTGLTLAAMIDPVNVPSTSQGAMFLIRSQRRGINLLCALALASEVNAMLASEVPTARR